MIYLIKDVKTDKELFRAHSDIEKDEIIEMEDLAPNDYYIIEMHSCRGCSEEKDDVQERSDAYGIFTGHYCEECYENNYPYRKDRYPTVEHHGYGERLNDDY